MLLLDSSLHVLLAEQHRQLLFLERRWSTPLASNLRFSAAVQEATKTAHALSGADTSVVFNWMPPAFAPTVITDKDESTDNDFQPSADIPANVYSLDSENLIAEDDLEGGDDVDDEESIEEASATILWTLPVSSSLLII